MAKGDFNSGAMPKARTERFKLYVEVDGELELQGRGITSYTIEQNQDVSSESDVLGYVDLTRSSSKPQQTIDTFKFRKDSKLGKIIFNAFYTGDTTALDSLTIYQKFEFVEGDETGTCLARKMPESLINITSFGAEAENDITVSMDIYYSGQIITGTMPITDGLGGAEFTADAA